MSAPATFLVDEADVPALRDAVSSIAGVGYHEKQVRERLGLSDITELLWRAVPVYRDELLAERDPLASAIDLFLLQGALPEDEVGRLLPQAAREVLVRAGVLWIDDQGLARARASLFPVGDRLVFSDHAWPMLPHPGYKRAPHDQVMAVGTDSHWLARITVRRPVGAALDLCTGSGVHALMAAFHSQRVVAVDIHSRAAQCARFNARALGLANVRVAVGDLFEPVRGDQFDLITANPPFVPSPVNSLAFRDGGRSGEEIQRRIVAGLPSHLAPGGIAQMVTELGERDGEALADRLREWLGGAPMDIHILRLRSHPAATYAIGHAEGDDSYGAFLDSVRDWAGNLRAQGYARVISVLLAFQWSDPASGPPFVRDEDSQPPSRDAGVEVEAAFAAERLARRPDLRETIERSRIRRAGPIGLMESCVLGHDFRASTQAQLLGMALPRLRGIDPDERQMLALLDKALSFPELLGRARGAGLEREAVFVALRSLVSRELILLSQG
jgi:hypothetical protein